MTVSDLMTALAFTEEERSACQRSGQKIGEPQGSLRMGLAAIAFPWRHPDGRIVLVLVRTFPDGDVQVFYKFRPDDSCWQRLGHFRFKKRFLTDEAGWQSSGYRASAQSLLPELPAILDAARDLGLDLPMECNP